MARARFERSRSPAPPPSADAGEPMQRSHVLIMFAAFAAVVIVCTPFGGKFSLYSSLPESGPAAAEGNDDPAPVNETATHDADTAKFNTVMDCDGDYDGSISRNELDRCVERSTGGESPWGVSEFLRFVQKGFETFDRNGDGKVNTAEIVAAAAEETSNFQPPPDTGDEQDDSPLNVDDVAGDSARQLSF